MPSFAVADPVMASESVTLQKDSEAETGHLVLMMLYRCLLMLCSVFISLAMSVLCIEQYIGLLLLECPYLQYFKC